MTVMALKNIQTTLAVLHFGFTESKQSQCICNAALFLKSMKNVGKLPAQSVQQFRPLELLVTGKQI